MKGVAAQRWGARYLQVHRADLITALSARLDALQPGAMQTGCPVRGYAPCKDGAEVILANGRRIQADLVIGADGIHSRIRHQMLGPDAPRFTGNYAWRALVPAAQLGALAPPPSGCIWAGPKKHAVTPPMCAAGLWSILWVLSSKGLGARKAGAARAIGKRPWRISTAGPRPSWRYSNRQRCCTNGHSLTGPHCQNGRTAM